MIDSKIITKNIYNAVLDKPDCLEIEINKTIDNLISEMNSNSNRTYNIIPYEMFDDKSYTTCPNGNINNVGSKGCTTCGKNICNDVNKNIVVCLRKD